MAHRPFPFVQGVFCRCASAESVAIIFLLVSWSFILINGDGNDKKYSASHPHATAALFSQASLSGAGTVGDVTSNKSMDLSRRIAEETQINMDGQTLAVNSDNGNNEGNLVKRNVGTNDNSIKQPNEIGVNVQKVGDGNVTAPIKNPSTPHRLSQPNENEHDGDLHERVLSRKRRYLIFPPGSSVQIVADTYHPILGYSNYLILGITAAMAWELPSKPVYLDEELHGAYANGDLPLLHRNDKNVTKIEYKEKTPSNSGTINSPSSTGSNYYYTNIPQQKYYYNYDNYNHQALAKRPMYYTHDSEPVYAANTNNQIDAANKIQSYVTYANKVMKQFKKLTEKIPLNRPLSAKDFQEFTDILAENVKDTKNTKSSYTKKRYNHFIHPAFKKRSLHEMTSLEKFDIKLHRRTRHALYKQIDTFLKSQGSNGPECVLKLLCETGQRDRNEKPGSMVMELLRAIFTMPEPTESVEHPLHREYDAAHASKKNCTELYPLCRESAWNSNFAK